jgi:hypothetical protein
MLDVSPDEIKLGYLLLKFLRQSARERPVNKFNVIGRSGRGEFEMWLQKDVLPHEKQTLIWVWDEPEFMIGGNESIAAWTEEEKRAMREEMLFSDAAYAAKQAGRLAATWRA